MFLSIVLLLGSLTCPPPGIVLRNAEIFSVLACSVGFACWRLLAILVLIHIIRIFTLFLLFRLVAGFLLILGGFAVGSWPHGMNLSSLSISEFWTVPIRQLKRCRSMSSKILILPGRLGFLSFHNSIRRLLMSVVFLLLAAGVTLAGLWVLSTLMSIR